MEPITMEIDGGSQLQVGADPLPFARSYQLEALEKAIHENTIVFLETGSGKTLIAIMLLRSYAYMLRKPSRHIAVFLVPKVVLVTQQAEAVKTHTDLKVGMYWGEMGVDYWDAAAWKKEIDEHEVLVMTPAILIRSLRHSFLKLDMIKLLIMDECHHAKGRDPYACIMKEFYHEELKSGISDLPRIFGMTASPIKSKGGNSQYTMSENIRDLMTLMHSKVYTCVSEDVIAKYVPISTPKFKFYRENEIPYGVFEKLAGELNMLKQQYELSLRTSDLTESVAGSAHKRIAKIFSSVIFCLDGLGVWLALKAAEVLSSNESESFSMCKSGDIIVRNFSLDIMNLFKTYLSSGTQWFVGDNTKSNVEMGLLTSKVCCLVDTLLEYRALSDMRCIVFVERVVTAVVLQDLLNALLPKYNSWKTKCIAGKNSGLHNQSRKRQNEIVEEFRMGMVNIIVATSILEEGLDVQSCNLVIRFDPCPTVCSFIQSRGRARMQNSDYILMVQCGDSVTHSRLEKYLASGDIMRKESLRHSSFPCDHFESDQFDEEFYRVESTKAIVTLSSSIELIHIFCSWLPSDGYFKPTPRWVKETGTLHLPKSCPIQTICVEGDKKNLKKIACLEACKKLHKIGALTDNLVPKIYVEEVEMQDFGNEPFNEEQPSYVPCELVNHFSNTETTIYHCYLIELNQNFSDDISSILLAMRIELDPEIGSTEFEMCFDKGSLSVKLRYMGTISLVPNLVLLCKRFQVTILRLLLDYNMDKLRTVLDNLCSEGDPEIDYLLLPTVNQRLDWISINSLNPSKFNCGNHSPIVWTNSGRFCPCMLRNSLVFTPHNGRFYITTDIMDLNGNSHMSLGDGGITTYKKYFLEKHGIKLKFEQQRLLNARHLYKVKNYCHGPKQQKDTEASKSTVELPPELCHVVMSPMPISVIHSFSFIPSIMHRVESLLVASNLKKMHLDHCMQNVVSTVKVLEAITSKSCGESFHYESLETLGDSFLKYATSQHLFQTYPNHHEGLLTVRREKIISNAALCKFGCSCKLPGFIRNARFDPQTWAVPGNKSVSLELEELDSKGAKAFISGKRKLRRKIIADVVEALIGAYLSVGGEMAALVFMNWIGIKVNFNISPCESLCSILPEKLINVNFLESLLNYSFRDRHLLVEALTHGSYMLPEIPRCYQRLEFLGDSVLDYLITRHLDNTYPGMSPGQLTDMRAASVNNDCYAWSAIKANLHKHILHASQDLHKDIVGIVHEVSKLSSASPIGWESDTSFPKVLGDIIESLAGAILVDSEYNKETVWQCIRPLLEPLVTPERLTVHPTRELTELCQKESYTINKTVSRNNGVTSYLMEVQAVDGTIIDSDEYSGYVDKKTAKKIVCRKILKRLKSKTQPK